MAEIRKLQINNTDIAPVTHENAVLDNDGITIPEKYVTKAQFQNELSQLGSNEAVTDLQANVNTLQTNVSALTSAVSSLQQIHYSTSEPTSSQGKNGDLWVVYKN